MLKLRRGVVRDVERPAGESDGPIVSLTVTVGGADRAAFADRRMVGDVFAGDDVVVNVEAVDLALGSGGRDVVVVNLTRGLDAAADESEHVMKLNYSPIQHGVAPVEAERCDVPVGKAVAVFQLHAQLPCVAWAAGELAAGVRVGYVQTAGGALPGGYSRTVAMLRERGLLCDHITAAPAYGGEAEAISTAGAIHAGLTERGWDRAIVGPGPGILGSATALGHGGMVALDSLHAALALGCRVVMAVRASTADRRERHRGVSHHTETVLRLALGPVIVAVSHGGPAPEAAARHELVSVATDLAGYLESGLPAETMGRAAVEDPLFFEHALAAGVALAGAAP